MYFYLTFTMSGLVASIHKNYQPVQESCQGKKKKDPVFIKQILVKTDTRFAAVIIPNIYLCTKTKKQGNRTECFVGELDIRL